MGLLCKVVLAAFLSVTFMAPGTEANSFPDKPVRLVVPYAPGGSHDIIARILATRLTEFWGQQVIVDNRSGASTQIGTQVVQQSAPDGYTWLLTGGALGINQLLYKDIQYDPFKDFTPVTRIGTSAILLVVRYDAPYKTLSDLIAAARANPGTLTYGYAGTGGSSHQAGTLLEHAAGIKMRSITYRGGAPALTDLLSGQITVNYSVVTEVSGLMNERKIRILGVSSPQRLPVIPDVPTIGEVVKDYEVTTNWLMVGPAGVPKEVVNKVRSDVVRALGEANIKERLYTLGVVPVGSTPEELEAFLRAEAEKWGRIFKAAGIEPQ